MNEGKICRSCKKFKTFNELKKDTRYTSSYSSFCKQCHKEHSIKWQKNNKEKVNKTRKLHYNKNKDKINEKRRSKYNSEKTRWEKLKQLYKITKEWYDETLQKQNNKCCICKINKNEYKKNFIVDHNHECCNKTPTCGNCNRGLLCNNCNLLLHKVEFDKHWFKKAEEYLNENSKNT